MTLAALMTLLSAATASAQVAPQSQWRINYGAQRIFADTAANTCGPWGAAHNLSFPIETTFNHAAQQCELREAGGSSMVLDQATPVQVPAACPVNSTGPVDGQCQCNQGTAPNAAGNACEAPNACSSKAGQSAIVNATTGWARSSTPGANDIVVDYTNGDLLTSPKCSDSCTVSNDSLGMAYRSQVPEANGLHRLSVDVRGSYTGEACTVQPDDKTNPAAPAASCPGYVGQVNGKPVCVGTQSSPLPSNPKPAGTPPETPGNPAAGPKPASGPGSGDTGPGRTPVSGSGGNAGGNGNAAIPGGGSDGNGQTGNDGGNSGGTPERPADPCGLPGRPACKIDETGTPNGQGAFDGVGQGVNQSRDAATSLINDAAGATGKSTGWSFTFQLPTGCAPLLVPGFAPYFTSIDICGWRDQFHDLMSMVWAATTLWACIGMVGRTIGST